MASNVEPGPLPEAAGLYVHFPFCRARCPYCDFAVAVARPEKRAAFVDSLRAEIDLWRDWPHPIDTVYFGGGTPSMLDPDALERILAALRAGLPLAAGASLALEANPEDVSAERVAAWRALGFASVSLGVQSFDDQELRRLGRGHRAERAREAVRRCLAAGFDSVSVDLMFGLDGQAEACWRDNLAALVALAPQHVSCYQLTIHPGTVYQRWRARGRIAEMPEERQATFYALTHEVLAAAGYHAYEVSNFARAPEYRSRHNLKYWRHVPYLGLGPSAHSFDGRSRWWNEREVGRYSARVAGGERPLAGSERLTRADLALEVLMLGLRLAEGIDLERFESRFGVDLVAANRELVDRLVGDGALALEGGRLRPSARGMAVADGLAASFAIGDGK